MNDERPPNDGVAAGEDPDTGAPIEELAGLREEADVDFLDRVRNRIHRRMLVVEVADWSWRAPFLVLMQWLLVLLDLASGGEDVSGKLMAITPTQAVLEIDGRTITVSNASLMDEVVKQ